MHRERIFWDDGRESEVRGMRKRVAMRWAIGFVSVFWALACGQSTLAADPPAAKPALPPGYGEVQVTVLGVTAPFTKFGILKRLGQVPGVEHVSFNMLHGIADVWIKPGAVITDEDLRHAVRNASYTAGAIKWLAKPGPTKPAATP